VNSNGARPSGSASAHAQKALRRAKGRRFSDYGRNVKNALVFEQEQQEILDTLLRIRRSPRPTNWKKFFGSFFQKRTASFT
jgi:hypothetical protein